MNETMQFQKAQIEALQKENRRLNNELRNVKEVAFKARLSDPAFDRPLSELEVEFETVKKISTSLVDGLTNIIECDRSWFTVEFIESTFISDGKISNGYPFIEILWFNRGQDVKDKVAKFTTSLLEKDSNYPAITVIFTDLKGEDYYENAEHF